MSYPINFSKKILSKLEEGHSIRAVVQNLKWIKYNFRMEETNRNKKNFTKKTI